MGQPRGKPTQEASTVPKAGGRKGRAGSLEPGNGVGGSKLVLLPSSRPPVFSPCFPWIPGNTRTKQSRGRGSRMDLRAPGPGLAHGRWVWGRLYFPKMATLILPVLLVFLER